MASLDDRFTTVDGTVHLTGIQSLVRVLVDQRRADARRSLNTAGFVSGYPGSPLGTLDLELARWRKLLDEHHVVHAPGLNEELAATAVFGSQLVPGLPGPRYDGVFGMWFGKAPGVDRAADAFRHGNYRGIAPHGGVLAVAGDDPNAKSTIIPSDSTVAFYDWYMPVLYPGDVQGVVDLGLHGYALSRASGLAVGLKIVTNVADSSGTAEVGADRIDPVVPTVELDGQPFRPVIRPNHSGQLMLAIERELVEGRLELARRYAYENGLDRIVARGGPGDHAWLGIIAAGRAYHDLRQALTDLGLDDAALAHHGIRIMQQAMLFPLEPRRVVELAAGLDEILVVEDKRPYVETFVKDTLYGRTGAPRVVGKKDDAGRPLLPGHGELNPDLIARALARRLAPRVTLPSIDERLAQLDKPVRKHIEVAVARGPYFCSGCPHNRSLVVPDGSVVGAGIGCHIMAIKLDRPEFGELAGFTQMGGEGSQWVGVAPFSDVPHFFQNLGDGTFFHSGSLALRFAVTQGVNVTYKLLYNGAVGMTGGQDVTGAMPVRNLLQLLEAEGVRRVIITTEDLGRYRRQKLGPRAEVWHRDRMLEAEEALAATEGVTVLVHDQECAAELRRKRKRGLAVQPTERVWINERVCEGCGDCGTKSNCISVQPVETEFGRKTQIHQSSCNFDYSCLQGDCPSFLTVEPGRSGRAKPAAAPRELPDPADLPEPVTIVPADDFSVYMTGIGGTGVVTVSQVLATAAAAAGRQVRTLDLTGASQKAGAVVSQLRVLAPGRDAGEVAGAVTTGGSDLYLAFDALSGATDANLHKAEPGRTVAVVSTSRVPTGKMTTDPGLAYPGPDELRRGIDAQTRAADNVHLDAQLLAEQLFGDHMAANLLLVGAAYQAGALPLAAGDIEAALRLNGVAAERNIAAFRWGRVAVAHPDRLPSVTPAHPDALARRAGLHDRARALMAGTTWSPRLLELLDRRVPDLIDYQSPAYARDYVEAVRGIAAAEQRIRPDRDDLAATVAVQLHRLMAYKDEYEVARLQLDPEMQAELAAAFGPGARVRWNLHPPVLRALGMHRKIRLGRWFGPAFHALRAVRRVRGHRLDVFGWARVRRIERALIVHYRSLVERAAALGEVEPDRYEDVVRLAGLADMVRGYEAIKVASIERYLAAAAGLAGELGLDITVDLMSPLPALLAQSDLARGKSLTP
ncbi:MAG TPA: indolepyruvate ferredoxin oxidoreductase family protein, partial [Acidimicrobiales bacterium]|nr:indolepyruvate ferredoxin oxidoreductase family protein [Acidimicrobiales bacterium]